MNTVLAIIAAVASAGALAAVLSTDPWFRKRRTSTAVDRVTLALVRPQGVRIEHADGTETLCELSFDRVDAAGFALWKVQTLFNPGSGDRLRVDMMPARSGLVLSTTDDPSTLDELRFTGRSGR